MTDETIASPDRIAGRYRMPVCFGPSPGPRQGPSGAAFDWSDARRTTTALRFRTDRAALARYLPPNCRLQGDPVVLVEHVVLHNLAWLAGRGYSLLSVKFPVCYEAEGGTAVGPFLAVLWENRPEPIITGREELGFAKLYCELPPPQEAGDRRICEAWWDGHCFARLQLASLAEAEPPMAAPGDGVLHHRYAPPVSPGGQSIDEMVITPARNAVARVTSFRAGTGSVEFLPSTWEQMPTMAHVANALAALPVIGPVEASVVETVGSSDLREQRVLGPIRH